MTLSDDVLAAGRQVAAASGDQLGPALKHLFEQFAGWPYLVSSGGTIVDAAGTTTPELTLIIHASATTSTGPISADNVAAVIDAVEVLDRAPLSASYERIAAAKRLRRRPAPHVGVVSINTAIGVVFSPTSNLSLEEIAEELLALNAQHHNNEWPDIVVVASTGAVNYLAQFPGEPPTGDFIVPAEGTIGRYPPPMYVVVAMRPTGQHSINTMVAFVTAHLAIFSPGARLPDWQALQEGVPTEAVTT
jgi:hypothetical protein